MKRRKQWIAGAVLFTYLAGSVFTNVVPGVFKAYGATENSLNSWGADISGGMGMYVAAALSGTDNDQTEGWFEDEGRWRYRRDDGSLAKNQWEEIDGSRYHFGADAYMQTGWHKISNIWYDLGDDGRLVSGWSCRWADGEKHWYYFDDAGNAVIQWLYLDGEWYWFSPDGIMNAEPELTIKGKNYYFHSDGRLAANEYRGLSYLDMEGQPDPNHDMTAEDVNGTPLFIDSGEADRAAAAVNQVPSGWLKKFTDNGWRFIYSPQREEYTSVRNDDGQGRYSIRYRLDTINRLLYFTDPEALSMAFGEYVYRTETETLREMDFWREASWHQKEICQITGLPEAYAKKPDKMFGALFAVHLDEEKRGTLEKEKSLDYICRILTEIETRRGPDGKPVSQ